MRLLGLLALVLAALVLPASAAAPATTSYDVRPAVVEKRTIGLSVRGRPIRAWRLGEPGKRRVVLISTMHGNEPHTRRILESLRDGRTIRGIDLWVIPTYNPDGLARGTRRNARGVDLNRNFPHKWADLDGNYESGRHPASEPETRAVMAFLRGDRPTYGCSASTSRSTAVDTDTKDRGFARRLPTHPEAAADHARLRRPVPRHHDHVVQPPLRGAALTVEYGAHPSRRRMEVEAPRQLLGVLGAHRTSHT